MSNCAGVSQNIGLKSGKCSGAVYLFGEMIVIALVVPLIFLTFSYNI